MDAGVLPDDFRVRGQAMNKNYVLFVFLAAALLASPAPAQQQAAKDSEFLAMIASGKTVMWVGAHPDDEIISAPLPARGRPHQGDRHVGLVEIRASTV